MVLEEKNTHGQKPQTTPKTPEEQALNIFQKGYNQQVIFYGPPGTSKTYTSTILAAKTLQMIWENGQWETKEMTEDGAKKKTEYEIAQEYLNDENGGKDRFSLVQFHPSYTYEDFIRGIEVKTQGSQVTYDVVNKVFGKIADKAHKNYESKDKTLPYVLIIDEINRAPLASVLGELIYGLEYRGNAFSTPYTLPNGTNQLTVPPNLFIIGTMNTADRSIGAMDYAVRRRFAFISLPSEPKVIMETWKNSNVQDFGKLICDNDETSKIANTMDEKQTEEPNDTEGEGTDSPSTTDPKQPKYTGLYARVSDLFTSGNIADPSIDKEDIMLGHTYFLCDPDKCTGVTSATEYMQYRLDYQIKPILREYVKDGLLNSNVMGDINKLQLQAKTNDNDL